MKRLTKRTPVEFGYAEYVWDGDVDEQDAISRLAAYENTGLTPKDIGNLQSELEQEKRRYKFLYDGSYMANKAHAHKMELRANAAESDNVQLTIQNIHLTEERDEWKRKFEKCYAQLDREEHEFEALITDRERQRDEWKRRADAAIDCIPILRREL